MAWIDGLTVAATTASGGVPWLKILCGVGVMGALGAAWEEFKRPPNRSAEGVIVEKTEVKGAAEVCGLLCIACVCAAFGFSWFFLLPAVVLGCVAASG